MISRAVLDQAFALAARQITEANAKSTARVFLARRPDLVSCRSAAKLSPQYENDGSG
jgi:hypothetical protein